MSDIVNILNSILVNEDIRPAMLVQPSNYNEATGDDPKTKLIIERIKELFPNLIFSDKYEIYQGVIISKTNYNGEEISLERMGEILGYPCYKDFCNINPDDISYGISVVVKHKNNTFSELFSNKCKDTKKIEIFKTFAAKAKEVFDKEEYKDILNGFEVDKVNVKIRKIIPNKSIINTLIQNKILDKFEIFAIENILYNLQFTEESITDFSNNIQYTNLIHKGIILGLLMQVNNDLLSPFYPLQEYPQQQMCVSEIIKDWEKELLDIVKKTKQ